MVLSLSPGAGYDQSRLRPLAFSIFLGLLFCALSLTSAVWGSGGDLSISTYPIGLVTGALPVEVDLGGTGVGATLYLDGQVVCEMTPETPRCTVNLGEDPHVHLLELVRAAPSGGEVERAFRWINRPGQEAELRLQLGPPNEAGECRTRLLTNHPLKQQPAVLDVMLDGVPQRLDPAGSLLVPCQTLDAAHILTAAAIFPDGRRVEDVRLLGGYSGNTESQLTALPVLAAEAASCDSVSWPSDVVRAEQGGYEVVFVLDPEVPYQSIFKTGWHVGSNSASVSGNSASSTLGIQQRDRGPTNVMTSDTEMGPLPTWSRAEVHLQTAEKLWYVAPSGSLPRVNGFSVGKKNWLQLLFKFGMGDSPGSPRLADAVASSGLVAAAGPRRRAVVLILSNKNRDESLFTPRQAMNYLAEVGVPLVVLRAGKPKGDGWPDGLRNSNISAMGRNLERVVELLDQQCIVWFEGDARRPNELAAVLPDGFQVVGHEDGPAPTLWAPLSDEELALFRSEPEALEPSEIPREFEGRLDLVAVTVLVSAEDAAGQPVVDLSPVDLAVAEDGRSVAVVGVERIVSDFETSANESGGVGLSQTAAGRSAVSGEASEPLGVSIYIEPTLASRSGLKRALQSLAENAERLVALGPVEIISGNSRAETVLSGTRDAQELETFLTAMRVPTPSRPPVESIRNRFLSDIRQLPGRAVSPNRMRIQTLAAAGEEHHTIATSIDTLAEWVRSHEMGPPRLVLLVGLGVDDDPTSFYVPLAEGIAPGIEADLRSRLDGFHSGERLNQIASELAESRWRVLTVATETSGASTASASQSGSHRFQSFLTDGPSTTLEPGYFLLDPLGTQQRVARPSGGEVVVGARGLASSLEQSAGWYRLTYQVERGPDGSRHELEVTSRRAGVEINAPTSINTESSEGRAEHRLRRLLQGNPVSGNELPIRVDVGPSSMNGKQQWSPVEITTDLASLEDLMSALGGGVFRVTVMAVSEDGGFSTMHQTVTLAPMAGFVHAASVEWSESTRRLAVSVEDLVSGVWGGAVVDLP